MPPIEGFGAPGTVVLRSADDAIALRAFAQRHGARRAAIAGGGLLGLEAAYALHKLGLQDRRARALRPPATRQLDARAAEILRDYLEGLGLEYRDGGRGRGRRRQRPPARRRRSPTAAASSAYPARRRRHPAQRRAGARPPGWRSSAACSSTSACAPTTRRSSPRATWPSTAASCPGLWPTAVAHGRGRGRQRRRRREDLRGHRAGHDPQGRRHRADLDRPLRAELAGRRGDRARGRPPAPATASS